MNALWLAALAVAGLMPDSGPDDEVSVTLRAEVSEDLERLDVDNETVLRPTTPLKAVEVILAADRYRALPDTVEAFQEPELYRGSFDAGGFSQVSITVDGTPCPLRYVSLPEGERKVVCPGVFAVGRPIRVRMQARLKIPARYGPFSRTGRQVTLGAGWYPYVARADLPPPRGRHRLILKQPEGFAVAVGSRVHGAVPGHLERVYEVPAARHVPLVLLPPGSGTTGVRQGRGRLTSRWQYRPNADAEVRLAEVQRVLEEGLRFLETSGLTLPSVDAPLWLVEAPLRHNLVRLTDGVLLVSDRAFQLTPVDRFQRFHGYPVLRGIFTAWALSQTAHRRFGRVEAEAVGAWLLDRYVASTEGEAEDAFDVLSLWSFIPAVDSILYAPQLPFVNAYFRLIREEDPHQAPLVDFPAPWPGGKVIYEKLLDRLGPAAVAPLMRRLVQGDGLVTVVREALGDETDGFLTTWLGPYPEVQYRLHDYGSTPIEGPQCGAAPGCHLATVVVERTGEVVSEPLTVLVEDDDGASRRVVVAAGPEARRTVTATLAAPLDFVYLDPSGRLAETPSAEVPSPKFDNRSSARWRVLLNSFNFAASPTAGTLDTALNLGYSRVRDVRWRFGTRASYAPEALRLSQQASYRFGAAVTPDSLSQWVGLSLSSEYLRPEFAGARQDAFVAGGSLFYGYDSRKTVFAPEPGTAYRVNVSYRHVFGDLPPDQEREVTQDAVSMTLRALKSWRFDAAHQFSIRGSLGGYLFGEPRTQQLYTLGGRAAVRGYAVDDTLGRWRAIGSAEWVHPLLVDVGHNLGWLFWVNRLDGALFADVAWIGDRPADFFDQDGLRADVGYGFRIFLDYFGVRPGVMAVDIAFPLVNDEGRAAWGPPAVYIDFAQSFLVF